MGAWVSTFYSCLNSIPTVAYISKLLSGYGAIYRHIRHVRCRFPFMGAAVFKVYSLIPEDLRELRWQRDGRIGGWVSRTADAYDVPVYRHRWRSSCSEQSTSLICPMSYRTVVIDWHGFHIWAYLTRNSICGHERTQTVLQKSPW